MPYDLNGKTFETDEEGYLDDFEGWSEDLASIIAEREDVALTEDHWEVLRFLRDYYSKYRIAPAIRVLAAAIGRALGEEKGNNAYLYSLFPLGPAKQACKIAGLPKPTGCV